MRSFFSLFLLLSLSACNGASISTQWKLRNFNIAKADLAQTRFALAGPSWTAATPESAIIELRYWRDGDDETKAKSLALHLQKAAHGSDKDALLRAGGSSSLAVMELSPASLAAARAAQEESARLRAEGAKTRGRFISPELLPAAARKSPRALSPSSCSFMRMTRPAGCPSMSISTRAAPSRTKRN